MNVSEFLKELKKSEKAQHKDEVSNTLSALGVVNGIDSKHREKYDELLSLDDLSEASDPDRDETPASVTLGLKRQRYDNFGRVDDGRIKPREDYEEVKTYKTNHTSDGNRFTLPTRKRVVPLVPRRAAIRHSINASVDSLRKELLQRHETYIHCMHGVEKALNDTDVVSRSGESAGVEELLIAVEDLLSGENGDSNKCISSAPKEHDDKAAEPVPEILAKSEIVTSPLPEVHSSEVVVKKSLFARAKILTSGTGSSSTKEGEDLCTKKFKR